jgi:hypothetical protein
MKQFIIKKLTSRKLWLAVSVFVAALIVEFGGNPEQAERIAALIVQGATVVAYIVSEGLIDAAAVEAPTDKQ